VPEAFTLNQTRPAVRAREPLPPELRERDDRVHAIQQRAEAAVQPPLPALLSQDAVRGQQARAGGRQQAAVERRDRQPLIMAHVGAAAIAPIPEHAGQVLGELQGPAAERVRVTAAGATVERLADLVAQRSGNGAVGEPAGHQLDLGAGARERGAQGTVVGWREGRGIDDLDAHSRGLWRWSCPTAW
jgi:hypothetical protein